MQITKKSPPPRGCRLESVDVDAYRPPPPRSRAHQRRRWQEVWRTLERDTRPNRAQRRAMRSVLLGLHHCRDFRLGVIDPTLPRLAEKSGYGVTATKDGLGLLRRFGYLEVIPRREFDPNCRPPGWRGKGRWVQASNAYELKLPSEPLRWPGFAPPDYIDIPADLPPPSSDPAMVELRESFYSEAGIRLPSFLGHISPFSLEGGPGGETHKKEVTGDINPSEYGPTYDPDPFGLRDPSAPLWPRGAA